MTLSPTRHTGEIFAHKGLILALAKREVQGRYRGASFGLLWSLISPFLMLLVYTFAFENILKNRWPAHEAGTDSFAIILFVGIVVHGFFAESFSRAPTLVTGNVNYVKKVVFPLQILPFPMLLSALFHLVMNVAVLLFLMLVVEGRIPPTALLIPVVLAPLALLMLGVSWCMAALGVYFKDINQITGVVSTAVLFTSSAIIPTDAVSDKYRVIFELNPLTFIIDQARQVALWGGWPDWAGLGVYCGVAAVLAVGGYAWFMATRKGFADVV
ncbi:MAG: sugar ABC transporter permease [Stenotrophomonas acidaminiphila]|nr:MAG: sugar ABC transporter permease [Stenotrophomonas acidaminiphila]